MTWNTTMPWKWHRFLVAIALIAVAAALRVWPLQSLGARVPWLTFYPVVMVAGIHGGLAAGLLATGLACLAVIFLGPQLVSTPFIKDSADWLGMTFFCMTCTMMSFVAQAMRRANQRSKQAQEKAEAASKAKSTFLASMSHELRTPLNAILGFSNLMRNDAGLSGEQRKTLDVINRSGEHLLGLINDVLDMAKVEAGSVSAENALLDLFGMVRNVLELLRVRAEEKGVELLLAPSSEFPRFVRTDGDKLRQALINLIGNAIKFTEQGCVTLRLNARPGPDAPGRLLLIAEVEDTGVGIAAEDLARIFDPFVQVGNLTFQKGTGLGLTITRNHVELLGGRINVLSLPGKGTTFHVEIPVEAVTESEARAAEIKNLRVIGLAPGQPDCRILIVEDQEENRLLLRRMLEPVGFSVRMATNGAEGIAMYQDWRPQFIWMDVRMPILDGIEATRRIRLMDGGSTVKIAAVTASVFKDEREKVLAAGMDDFVRKPFRPDEIFDCLARQLGLRFVYAETTADTSGVPLPALQPDAFAALPAELRATLTASLLSLDAVRIAEAIHGVSGIDAALGAALSCHADGLGYSTILRALQTGHSGAPVRRPGPAPERLAGTLALHGETHPFMPVAQRRAGVSDRLLTGIPT